ncbi:MAG: (2Fe-2S) ferredoxin domain-containing protein, partial [Planctomycetes bacterium]|nr:(2Fe-2S) ferredoxin domain-containing protein [Planctomycetota bacterium]
MLGSIQSFRKHHEALKKALDPDKRMVTICGGTGCTAFGSSNVRKAFESEIEKRGLADEIPV